jgi:Ras-related GTP-binding protein A/B
VCGYDGCCFRKNPSVPPKTYSPIQSAHVLPCQIFSHVVRSNFRCNGCLFYSIIFANYLARDTTRLSPTLDVEHHHVRFLGDLVLNLWDCGGQDAFYESYFERDRETIFRGVELLIYVFDIESETPDHDFDHFCGVLEAIEENSPDARIFLLIHKMDLVAPEDREAILEDRKRLIADSCLSCGVENFSCFGTSIWDVCDMAPLFCP